jgi:hypothetical protein
MKNLQHEVGVLSSIERLPNSINGNPRYSLYLDKGAFNKPIRFVTAPDSSLAYSIGNCEGHEVSVVIGTHYGRPTLAEFICCYGGV